MGVHFPAVDLDNAIGFSILSRMPGFLWHSSKWTCRFGHFLQYTSGLKVLACSLDTDINYVTTMLRLSLSLNHYVQLQQLLGERCDTFSVATFWVYSSGRSLLLIATMYFIFCKLSYQQILRKNKHTNKLKKNSQRSGVSWTPGPLLNFQHNG